MTYYMNQWAHGKVIHRVTSENYSELAKMIPVLEADGIGVTIASDEYNEAKSKYGTVHYTSRNREHFGGRYVGFVYLDAQVDLRKDETPLYVQPILTRHDLGTIRVMLTSYRSTQKNIETMSIMLENSYAARIASENVEEVDRILYILRSENTRDGFYMPPF